MIYILRYKKRNSENKIYTRYFFKSLRASISYFKTLGSIILKQQDKFSWQFNFIDTITSEEDVRKL